MPDAVPLVATAGIDVGGEPGIVVDCDEAVTHCPYDGRQAVVGVLQAGPHGVAADLGSLEHVEDRTHRGCLQEGHVGVPPAGAVDLAVDGEDLGTLVDGREHRVGLGHLTELAREVSLLPRGE